MNQTHSFSIASWVATLCFIGLGRQSVCQPWQRSSINITTFTLSMGGISGGWRVKSFTCSLRHRSAVSKHIDVNKVSRHVYLHIFTCDTWPTANGGFLCMTHCIVLSVYTASTLDEFVDVAVWTLFFSITMCIVYNNNAMFKSYNVSDRIKVLFLHF